MVRGGLLPYLPARSQNDDGRQKRTRREFGRKRSFLAHCTVGEKTLFLPKCIFSQRVFRIEAMVGRVNHARKRSKVTSWNAPLANAPEKKKAKKKKRSNSNWNCNGNRSSNINSNSKRQQQQQHQQQQEQELQQQGQQQQAQQALLLHQQGASNPGRSWPIGYGGLMLP